MYVAEGFFFCIGVFLEDEDQSREGLYSWFERVLVASQKTLGLLIVLVPTDEQCKAIIITFCLQ